MKKKIIIITIFILILITLSLYYTYATDVSMDSSKGEVDLTYNIDIKDTSGRSITVKAGSTKTFDIFISNNNGGTINYGLAYSPTKEDGIIIAQVNTSKNKVSELIENNTTHQISLIIINNTSSDITYSIIPVTGYEKGGDLIVPTGYTLISDVYSYPVKPNKPKLVEGLIPIKYDGEKWVKSSTNYGGWYDDYSSFVSSSDFVGASAPWFARGGSYSGSIAGVFFFDRDGGNANSNALTRSSLIVF